MVAYMVKSEGGFSFGLVKNMMVMFNQTAFAQSKI